MESSRSPGMLWHYTDVNGLLGILQSDRFWASSATYLNDDQELNYGRDCLIQVLLSIAGGLGTDHSDEPGAAIEDHARALAGDINLNGGEFPSVVPDTYIVSFCEEGDLLSQWRGYSEGSGFAIGFDRKTLEDHANEASSPARLEKVRYGNTASKEMFEPIIWDQLRTSANLPVTSKEVSENILIDQLCESAIYPQINIVQLLQEIGWCKHPAFKDEKEWRLKIDQPDSIKVRPRRGDLLPYTEFPFPRVALKEIRLGPGGFRALRENATKHALKEHGFPVSESESDFDSCIRVSRSSAPYRP